MNKKMLRRIFSILLCGSVAAVSGGCAAKPATVKIRPEKALKSNGGVFEGWGTSLCWWANRIGYSDELAGKAAESFFSPEGLGLNVMRYNIGGGDDPAHDHIRRTDSMIPGWLVKDEESGDFVYDVHADHNQLNVMLRAVEAAGADAVVEVFSNSPPYFMTVSGCSSGGEDPNKNNLREDCVEEFADYLAWVTDYIQRELGVRVTSLSPMNEPNSNFWTAMSWKQEGCHVDAGKAQSDIIEAVAQAMARYELGNVIISASDETNPEVAITAWEGYSEEARRVLGRLNAHTYGEQEIDKLGELAKKENLKLWMSEVDGDGTAGEAAGEMGAALWLARKIISDINALEPSAWVMWQVIDNHVSRDGYMGRRDSGMVDVQKGYWGMAVADHDRQEIVLTQKYYGMGQFSRYIRPGMTVVTVDDNTLAAFDPESGRIVVVAVNAQAAEKTVTYDLSGFGALGAAAQAVRTSGSMAGGEHWAQLPEIPVQAGGFTAQLKGNSITTFLLDGVKK